MVKGAIERLKKYEGKFDADVVSKRYTTVKDLAVEKATTAQSDLVTAAQAARSAMEDEGVAAILSGFFQSFANMCIGIKRKYGIGIVAAHEVQSGAKYWLDALSTISLSPTVTDQYVKGKAVAVMNKILSNLEIPVELTL